MSQLQPDHSHAHASPLNTTTANSHPTTTTTTNAINNNTQDDTISILSFDDDLYDYDDHLFPHPHSHSVYPHHATAFTHTKDIPTTTDATSPHPHSNANAKDTKECYDPVERRDRRIKRWLAQQCGFTVDLGLDFWDEEEGCQCVSQYNSYPTMHGEHHHSAHEHHHHHHQHTEQHTPEQAEVLALRHRDSTRTMTTMNTVTSASGTTEGTSRTSGGVSEEEPEATGAGVSVSQEAEERAEEGAEEENDMDGVLSDVGTGTGTIMALTATMSEVPVQSIEQSQSQDALLHLPPNITPNLTATTDDLDASPLHHNRTGADSPLLGYPVPQPGDDPISDPLLFPCANWVRELPVGEPMLVRRRSREKAPCCAQCHSTALTQNHGQQQQQRAESMSRERVDQSTGSGSGMNTGAQAPVLAPVTTLAATRTASSPATPYLTNPPSSPNSKRTSRSTLSHKQSSSTSSSVSRNHSVSHSHSRTPSLAPSSSKSTSSKSRPTSTQALAHSLSHSHSHSRSPSQVLSISIGQALSLPPVQSHPGSASVVSSPRIQTHALTNNSKSSPASPVLSRRPSLMRQPSLPLLGENSVLMHAHAHSHSQSSMHNSSLPHAQAQAQAQGQSLPVPVPMTRSRAPSNASVHFAHTSTSPQHSLSALSASSPLNSLNAPTSLNSLNPTPLSPLPPSSPPTRRQSRAASTLFTSLSNSVTQLSELGIEHQHQYSLSQSPQSLSQVHEQHQYANSHSHPTQGENVDGADDDAESAISGGVSVRNAVYIDSEEVRERLDRLLGVRMGGRFSVGGFEEEEGQGQGQDEAEEEGQELEMKEKTEEWVDQLTPGAEDDGNGVMGYGSGVLETPKKRRDVVPPNSPAVPQSHNGFGGWMSGRASRSVSRRTSEVKLAAYAGLGHRRGGGSGGSGGSRSGSGSHSGHGHGPATTTNNAPAAAGGHGWYSSPFASSSQVYLGSGGVSEEGHVPGQLSAPQAQLPPTPISMISGVHQVSPRPSLTRLRSGSVLNSLASTSNVPVTTTAVHQRHPSLSIGDTIPLPLPTPPPLSAAHKPPTRPPPAPLLDLDDLPVKARSGPVSAVSKTSGSSRPQSARNSGASPVELEEEMVFSKRPDLSDEDEDEISLEFGGRRRKGMSVISTGAVPKCVYDEEEDVYGRYYEGSSEGHEAREDADGEEENTVRRRPAVGRGLYGRYFGDEGVSGEKQQEQEEGNKLEAAVSRWSLGSSVMAGDHQHSEKEKEKGGKPSTPASTNPSTKGGRSRSGSTSAFVTLGVFGNKEKERVSEEEQQHGKEKEKDKDKELLKEKKRSRLVSFISRLSVGGALSSNNSSPSATAPTTPAMPSSLAPAPLMPLPLLPVDARDVYVPPSAGGLLPPAPIISTANSSDKPKKPTQLRLDVEQSNVQGVVALNGEVGGVWNPSSRSHSLSDVTATPPQQGVNSKSAPGSPTVGRGRVTFKDVPMPMSGLTTKTSMSNLNLNVGRPSLSGSPKGTILPSLPTSPASSVPMPLSPSSMSAPLSPSFVPIPMSPPSVPLPMSPKSPMSLKSMTSMASMELTPQGQALSTSPPQPAFMSQTFTSQSFTSQTLASQGQSKIVRTGSAQAFRTENVVVNERPATRPRASSAADLLMMMKPRPSVVGLMERAQVQQHQQAAHPLSQSSVPRQQYQQPQQQQPSVQPILKRPILTKSMSMGVLSGSAILKSHRYDVPLTPSSFASTRDGDDDDEEDDDEESDDEEEDEDEEYGVELTGEMRRWGLGMGKDGEKERDDRLREERVFVPMNEQVLPAVPFSTNPNRASEEHTVTVYPNTAVDQGSNTNAHPNNTIKISGVGQKPSLDINMNMQTAQHGSPSSSSAAILFPQSPAAAPVGPTVAKVESVFMALAPTRGQLQMKPQPPLPSSTLQAQPFQRLRLKSMSSVGNLPSSAMSPTSPNNSPPMPTPTLKAKNGGFRGLAIRMGLVNAGPASPATPNSLTPSPMPTPSPMASNHNLLNVQGQGQRELIDPYANGYLPYDSPTSMTIPMSASSPGGILGTMKKARTPKRLLVISGVDVEDIQTYEAVKSWCESLGEVREIKRVANGSLYVDFKKASVAEAVCRLQAQVTIKGAGSVSVSWATKSKKKTI
ncbi:hypothetical protein BJ165DRAFT_1530080 [Panaeolus papilionaceus]|nr:hypothetical protein BJ165DRAFT_1530080 [Panaeolus papilionaceus]